MQALVALLLAGGTVADTDRAFAASAQREGQWTAFRTYAASDAIMFAPDKVDASRYLANMPDPAESVKWQAAQSITSCDRSLAFTTGAWTNKGGAAHGSYQTIWRAERGGWAWIYDGGHDGPAMSGAATLVEQQASCDGAPAVAPAPADSTDGVPIAPDALNAGMFASDEPPPAALHVGTELASGGSTDRSLLWRINALPDGDKGARLLRLWSWDGRRYTLAVADLSGSFRKAP
jgi:hypothetical protein